MHAALNRRLRVAIVAASLRIVGGQAIQAQRMLDGWGSHGDVEAWLVPINPLPPKAFRWLLGIKFARTLITQLCYWPLLFRELRRADVVHVFSASYASFLLAPLPAIVVSKLLNRPVILNYHSGEAPDHLRRSAIARLVLRKWVDGNVVPSTFLRDVLASFGISAIVVPNTIDLTRFAYRVRDPLRPRLISTRQLEPLYNVSCTLRAFVHIQARYPEAALTVVGGGSQERQLRALAGVLNLRNITFVGCVPPSEVHGYYADADLYVQTPAIDNMPLSVLEAFASGLPVIATRTGGVPAMLTDGVHGLLVPDNDDAALALRVEQLIEDPAYAHRLAAAALQTCAAYEWPVVAGQWLAAYRLARRVHASGPEPGRGAAHGLPDRSPLPRNHEDSPVNERGVLGVETPPAPQDERSAQTGSTHATGNTARPVVRDAAAAIGWGRDASASGRPHSLADKS